MAEEMNKSSNEHAGSDEIRQQLGETRSDLGEKLESLQERVMDTVEKTRSAVEETVESAKETVQDTLQSISSTFDLKKQVLRNPWPMIGGAFFAGMFLAHLSRRRGGSKAPAPNHGDRGRSTFQPPAQPSSGAPASPGLIESLKLRFHDELNTLQSVAVGAGVSFIYDTIKRFMPAVSERIEEEFHNESSKTDDEAKGGPHNGDGVPSKRGSNSRM